MSATDKLINYIADLTYEDLPSQAINAVKTHIIDTVGAILAGSMADGAQKVLDLVKAWGGRSEGTVFVFGEKIPSPNAALVNSVMSRGYDFETILSGGATHVSASIIPAAFAIAEYSQVVKHKPITGKDIIVAIALGTDLNWRLRVAGGQSTVMAGGWLAETFSPPAIAAMGGKILGFEKEKLYYAMGIGYNQCCGTYGTTVGENGGLMAQLSQGLGTKAGVLSVLLADAGFTTYKDMIDGRWGLYTMYGDGLYDTDILTGDLGKRFDSLNPGIKRYPGCGATQPVVYGTLALIQKHPIKAEDIARVRIAVGEASYRLCGENKAIPSNAAEALWNHRYSAAVALIKGKVFVDDFTELAIKDPQVMEFIQKIDVEPEKLLTHGVEVEIKTKDGNSYTMAADDMNPMSADEIVEKFKKCNCFSKKPLPKENVEHFLRIIHKLEEIENINEVVDLLI